MAAGNPTGPAAGAGPRVVTTAAAERIAIPASGRMTVDVRALDKRILLYPARTARQLASRIERMSRLCPSAQVTGDTVELECTTRQLDARLVTDRGQVVLEIYELRGVPWRAPNEQLLPFYDPYALHMGGSCPGTTAISRGECALRDRLYAVAAVEFRRALDGDGKRMAALRLGDLAVLADDPVSAVGWYRAAGKFGPFGHMALVHLCELSGTCLPQGFDRVFDVSGMPEPLHTEILLRGARVGAYIGRWQASMTQLRTAIEEGDGACQGDSRLYCRQLVLAAFREADEEGVLAAIDAYLLLPERSNGALAEDLARAGAERAVSMGAPVFGGTLMAAAFAAGAIATRSQADYLLRTAEMYLLGKDTVRARLVCEFVESRLGRRAMTGPRWRAVLDQLSLGREAQPASNELPMAEAERDLAQAYRALAQAIRARLTAETAARAQQVESP